MECLLTPDAMAKIVVALLASNNTFGETGSGNYSLRLGQNLVTAGSIAGWQEATFSGYAPITGAVGWANGNDTGLNHPTMTLLPPAGGFRWVSNGTSNQPQTINSIRIDMIGNNQNYPMGSGILAPGQTVVNSGDQINVGLAQLTIFP